jgi:ribosomal protein S3
MGQKMNPLGFRVGITKQHQAQWYARFHKHQYAQSVLEDQMLRSTLAKLLPQLIEAKFGTAKQSPKISHIKIERGLIPYEITIQIHAQDCELIKAAIDKLDVKSTLLQKTLKAQYVLEKASANATDVLTSAPSETENPQARVKAKAPVFQRSTTKRLAKRQSVAERFQARFLNNMLLVKKGGTITRRLQNTKWKRNASGPVGKNLVLRKQPTQLGDFLNDLKVTLNDWNVFLEKHKEEQIQKYGYLRYAPLGYNPKWSLSRLDTLQNQPLPVLIQLVKALQTRAMGQLEFLRREYMAFGTLSKSRSFAYFQRIRFIKGLRQCIEKRRLEQVQSGSSKTSRETDAMFNANQAQSEETLMNFTKLALRQKLTNVTDENRKVKFIEHLQNLVRTHRTKNLALYLGTLAESRQYLRQIQRFTKDHSEFLFGVQLDSLQSLPEDKRREFVANQVTKTLGQISRKSENEKQFQEIFVQQFQKQKALAQSNLQLLPKISLKFYSVKPEILETQASVVAASIVDDLEKRKAFRRVIKQAKETLMKTARVKGVKIQVSGRLNGAEIARSEWVRAGRVPLQTLRANIDYSYKTAQTLYGIIGVKVWIYTGYTKLKKNLAAV